MERVDISVIIPVYNSEKYIFKCLKSLERQSMKNIEIILINDGSTDRTEERILAFVENHTLDIRLFSRENAGQAAARNFGMTQAKGTYIAFLDSDDYVDADYLEQMYLVAEKYKSDVVTSGYRSVKTDGTVLQSVCVSPYEAVSEYGKPGVFVVWAKLFRRSFLEENGMQFPEGGKIYEDVPFSLETKFKGRNVKAVSYVGYNYVQHEGSTMSSGSVKSQRFPYEKLEDAIQNTLENCRTGRERFEFEVLHFFAGFLFFYCRRAKKKDIDELASFAERIIREYFPRYRKNPYVGFLKVKELPILHRIAIWTFVRMMQMRMMKKFTFLITRI